MNAHWVKEVIAKLDRFSFCNRIYSIASHSVLHVIDFNLMPLPFLDL